MSVAGQPAPTALRFAVIGDPIGHSRSPSMHAAAYAAAGLPHRYEALHVRDAELADLVAQVRRGELAGVNVTVPHKVAVLEYVDAIAPSAQRQGAANTLRLEAGKVVAHNTDVPALAQELQALAPERDVAAWAASRALVLGSGGAARGAVAALRHHLGVHRIVVRARRFAEASERAAFAQAVQGVVDAGDELELVLEPLLAAFEDSEFDTLIQATSVGLPGSEPRAQRLLQGALDWRGLPSHCVALDVVYGDASTEWVRYAQERNLRACDGQGMLARQGALAYALWLGGQPPYAVMLEALRGARG